MKPSQPAVGEQKNQTNISQPTTARQGPAAVAGPEAIEGIHSIELTKLGQEAKSNRHNRKGASKGRRSTRKTKADAIKDNKLYQ
jgi:hypothetical protein